MSAEYSKNFNLGFSLVEIILVIVIIAALAGMVFPRVAGRSEKAKIAVARTDIEAHLATALKLYELDTGQFPTTDQGLTALLEKTETGPIPENWNGPYIEKEPIDPWGHPYIYLYPGEKRADYDLSSQGKNEKSEDDDITNWQQ